MWGLACANRGLLHRHPSTAWTLHLPRGPCLCPPPATYAAVLHPRLPTPAHPRCPLPTPCLRPGPNLPTLANASCTYPWPASDSTGITLTPAASHWGILSAKARCAWLRTPMYRRTSLRSPACRAPDSMSARMGLMPAGGRQVGEGERQGRRGWDESWGGGGEQAAADRGGIMQPACSCPAGGQAARQASRQASRQPADPGTHPSRWQR